MLTHSNGRDAVLRRLLGQTQLFGGLEAPSLNRILQATHRVKVRNREILFRVGDACTGLHIVVYGRIKLLQESPAGLEHVIRLIRPGASFGAAMMFLGKPYLVTAEAVGDTLLLYVEREALLREVDGNAALARRLLDDLSFQIYMLIGDIGAYTMRTGTQRLIGYLLRELSHADGATVRIEVSKQVLASRLNLTPERFSRIVRELSEQGLLRVRGRVFTVLDIDGLKTCY